MHLDYHFIPSAFGLVLLATQHNQLCWLSIGSEKEALLLDLQQSYKSASLTENPTPHPIYAHALNRYVESGQIQSELDLQPKGTPWQKRVWRELQKIPAGTTISYSDLALRCGNPKAARAVASACANNPIALFIPCHRIIGKSGTLNGYRWGVDLKQRLLNWEQKKDRV